MTVSLEGTVIDRLEPDETEHEVVRRNADDRTLLALRTGDHHPARAGLDVPILDPILDALDRVGVHLGLLEPVETALVAVRDHHAVPVGAALYLEAEPVVIDGHGDVLLYYPAYDVAGLRRTVENTLTAASSRADP
jgi:hypothetical protein